MLKLNFTIGTDKDGDPFIKMDEVKSQCTKQELELASRFLFAVDNMARENGGKADGPIEIKGIMINETTQNIPRRRW